MREPGEQVYYAAPAFWTQQEFNAAFFQPSVTANLVFVPPSSIGQIDDENSHRVVFNDGESYFLSKPNPIQVVRGRELLTRLGGPQLRTKFWEKHFWERVYLAVSSGTMTDEMIREYIDEQEGEQMVDDSRFPIDNP